MKSKDLIVRFVGLAGDGIVSAGRIFAHSCARLGLDLMENDSFGAEVRGKGKSSSTVRFSYNTVHSMGDGIDALVGVAAPNEVIPEVASLRREGLILYDADNPPLRDGKKLEDVAAKDQAMFGVPFDALANQATGSGAGKNIVALGALCYMFTLPPKPFKEQIAIQFGRKGDRVVQANLKAFNLGYDYCKDRFPPHAELEVGTRECRSGIVVTGNYAIAKGALDAGLKYFAGYPITPATPIMEYIAKDLPKLGGWMHQAEDEIASLGMVLGGSYAGRRSMTATSGPGLALMTELLGLAVVAEIPAVIVDVQRGGPSTGLPTKVEQSDLNLALYGGAGDCPRVVMAASSCGECYTGIKLAFDLAEKYQTPVVFLSDLFLANRVVTAQIQMEADRDRCTRVKPSPEEVKEYNRFKQTEDGVSPWLIPGEEGAFYTVTGLEHSEKGNPNYEVKNHHAMNAKRYRKFDAMLKDLPPPQILGDADAEIGFAAWGSTVGSVREAMDLARAEGIKTKLIRSVMIFPQDEKAFREFFASCRKIIIPEMNYSGQYAAVLKSRYGISPIEMHLPGIQPVNPSEILEKIREVHRELALETARV